MSFESKKSSYKSIRMACCLEMIGGVSYHGYTQKISLEGIFMESNDFSMPARKDRAPKVGDIGLFRFFFKHENANKSVAVMCRLVHVLPNGVGILANFSELTKKEHEILEKILESGSDKI